MGVPGQGEGAAPVGYAGVPNPEYSEEAMILGVHHPALAVPDMQKALDFYCGVVGFEQVMEADLPSGFEPMAQAFGLDDAGCKVRMVRKGNSCIELFEFASGTPGTPARP